MKKLRSLLGVLGPGFITGASDDDPSGIATYAQTGSIFGYSQLWLTLFSLPFMIVIQEMCGRIGMVTGMGLSGVMRRHYTRKLLSFAVTLLFIANTVNIGADLGAMAEAAMMLAGGPFTVWLIGMTALTLVLEIFVTYRTYAKFLKFLTFSLFTYIVTAFITVHDWKNVAFSTLVPHFGSSREYLMNVVAFLGTTITPYLFFWQADEEVEEEISSHRLLRYGAKKPAIATSDLRKMRIDTVAGMFFSNMISFFIIVTTASTLGRLGIRNIETADQAAMALRPIAGEFAYLLFAAGIIGTGLLATPVLSGSASYAFAEAFGWKAGLSRKLREAHGFYGVITIATLVGLLVNYMPIKPFRLLYYTAVLNGLLAPPLMVLILLIAGNRRIMGERANRGWNASLGWLITALMSLAAILMLVDLLRNG